MRERSYLALAMISKFSNLILILLIVSSCGTGKLKVLADLPMSLKEASAAETIPGVPLLWTIQDRGNDPVVYGLNKDVSIEKHLTVTNAENQDWEDLTSDEQGNLYIGDFGNNHKNRDEYTIYKLKQPEKSSSSIEAERIRFQLPEEHKSEDFEAFFLWKGYFYIFSKNHKKGIVVKVANTLGFQSAEIISTFDLEGKNKRITSADISDDGKKVALLAHDKLYLITDFSEDDFFSGNIKILNFEHDSQKEGIVFSKANEVVITDERSSGSGGHIYQFKL